MHHVMSQAGASDIDKAGRVLIPSRLRKLVRWMTIRKSSSLGCTTGWRSGARRNGDGTSPGPKTGTSRISRRSKIFFSAIGRPLRRVSRPRQSPVAFRSTSFRPSPKQPSRSIEDLTSLRASRKTVKAPSPRRPSEPMVRVTSESIELTLPVPPSVNHQYATVNGRRLLSAKGRAFKDLIGQQILVALAQSPHRGTLRQILQRANLSLLIHFFFASALRRDTDGGLKIAQDALCEGLGLNDNRSWKSISTNLKTSTILAWRYACRSRQPPPRNPFIPRLDRTSGPFHRGCLSQGARLTERVSYQAGRTVSPLS